MLAIEQTQLMAQIEITRIVAMPLSSVGIHPGIPFTTLHQHRCIWDQCIAADVVEVEMRIDEQIDLGGITAHSNQLRTNLLASFERDSEQPGEPRSKPTGGILLTVWMQTAVEQCHTLRVFNQVDRDRQGDVALAALHQASEIAGHRATGEGVKLD